MEWFGAGIFARSGDFTTSRSCKHISVEWTSIFPSHADLTYTIERRPDHNMQWKWTPVVEMHVPTLSSFEWNDTQVDARWEYTYRLHLYPSSLNGSAASYATSPVSPSCLAWSDRALSLLYSLRFRMENCLPTAARMLAFLGLLHLVLVLWRQYCDITFSPPVKPVKAPPPAMAPLRHKPSSYTSSTESESSSHRDSDLSTIMERPSLESIGGHATCKACSKKFGLFRRKTSACTRCSSTLCRGCRRAKKGQCVCRDEE
ncbi:hypothetical protein AaE_008823 [Aphanomyces astaci]|uniref:FYVE-type domain-containing protein n=1 Tax=Aphanomyces astaci TaxID=112090 RepID=A0A6A5AA45_APHAT|nr:hypothetical protein AaE_008823 [Aphanomyces astaci]